MLAIIYFALVTPWSLLTVRSFTQGPASPTLALTVAPLFVVFIFAGPLMFLVLRRVAARHEQRFIDDLHTILDEEPRDPPHVIHALPVNPPGWIESRVIWKPIDPLPETPPNFEESALEFTQKRMTRGAWIFMGAILALVVGYFAYTAGFSWSSLYKGAIYALFVVIFGRSLGVGAKNINRLATIVDPVALEIRRIAGKPTRYEWSRTRVTIMGKAKQAARCYLQDTADGREEWLDFPADALPTLLGSVRAARTLSEQRATTNSSRHPSPPADTTG